MNFWVQDLTSYVFEVLGTLSFAITGAQMGASKKMDIFGCSVLAFVTATGGGILRDTMLGLTPVAWMKDAYMLPTIFMGVVLTYFLLRWRWANKKSLLQLMFLFDTIGIAIFTIIGIEKGLNAQVYGPVALLMGLSSAVFGGVIRDVLAGEIPLILRKEVYATACLAGGFLYLGLKKIGGPEDINKLCTIVVIFILRFLAVKYRWTLPKMGAPDI